MTNTEEKLYKEAFKLFLTKPYELVTVRDLEKAIGMTRGAIFYYVKDKETLFKEVIERYYLKIQTLYYKVGEDILEQDITLLEFIDLFVAGVDKTAKKIYGFVGNSDKTTFPNTDRSYISLLLSTGYYIGSFNEKMSNIFQIDKNTWSYFIQKAIEKGEVKPNTDTKLLGELFTYTYLGMALNDSIKDGVDTKRLKELLLELYNKIKR
ncbi:MAG: TetR/AcrR family transcriptional regulator [Prevotellaceae bacterium]|jgi:AcrR family transcriptional regulator|nr:TetR/AcrR family transcriptional regulator [Prevotellaceae bacterium]